MGPWSGPGAGVRLRPLEPVWLDAAASLRGAQRLEVGGALGAGRTALTAAVSWERDPSLRFWGIGPSTAPERESDFRHDRLEVALRKGFPIGPSLDLELGAAWEQGRVARGWDDAYPDVHTTFGARSMTGLADETVFLRLGARGTLDRTHGEGVRRSGTRLSAAASTFLNLEDGRDFVRLEADAAGYLPLAATHGLALRTFVEANRGATAEEIPFTHLAAVGSTRGLRGFSRDRFRDRDAFGLMAEWRHELWRQADGPGSVEGFLFLDAAGVAPSLDAMRSLHHAYGFGFRFLRGGSLETTAWLALAGEKPGLGLRFDWPF